MNSELLLALSETCVMVGCATALAAALGVPLGCFLALSSADQMWAAPRLQRLCSWLVEVWRAVPFVLLLVLCAPLCRLLLGTTAGLYGALLAMTLVAIPLAARLTEAALRHVDRNAIDSARAMGASVWHIFRHVLVPEARGNLLGGMVLILAALLGCSAVAGALGAGGLGLLAVRKAALYVPSDVLLCAGIALIVLLQIVQLSGERLLRSRRGPQRARA